MIDDMPPPAGSLPMWAPRPGPDTFPFLLEPPPPRTSVPPPPAAPSSAPDALARWAAETSADGATTRRRWWAADGSSSISLPSSAAAAPGEAPLQEMGFPPLAPFPPAYAAAAGEGGGRPADAAAAAGGAQQPHRLLLAQRTLGTQIEIPDAYLRQLVLWTMLVGFEARAAEARRGLHKKKSLQRRRGETGGF